MQIKLNLFVEAMQDAPVIAAVKNDEGLDRALSSGCTVVFLLYGTILNIGELVRRVKEAGKLAFIHIDLIEGMSARDISAEYIASRTEADGVISTHPNLIRRARELGLLTIQRFFMLDSLSFANVLRQSSNADVVDVLPGAIPAGCCWTNPTWWRPCPPGRWRCPLPARDYGPCEGHRRQRGYYGHEIQLFSITYKNNGMLLDN